MKKSKASSVQPRKPASTALRWFARSAEVGLCVATAGTGAMEDEE